MIGFTKSRGRLALLMMLVLLLCLRYSILAVTLLPALTALLACMAIREFHRMSRNLGGLFSLPIALVIGAGIVVLGTWNPETYGNMLIAVLAVALILLSIIQMNRYGISGAVSGISASMFSLVYIAVPMSLSLQVLQLDRLFLFFGLLLIWTADSGAYFVGRKFGKHKLAPVLSPKKTIEGLLGGVAACAIIAALFKLVVPEAAFRYDTAHVMALGALIGFVAPVGDLAESVLKRDAGVKDSGTGLGGHGGALDRLDSMLFCIPIYYIYLTYLAH